jgi:hypothetical protein
MGKLLAMYILKGVGEMFGFLLVLVPLFFVMKVSVHYGWEADRRKNS